MGEDDDSTAAVVLVCCRVRDATFRTRSLAAPWRRGGRRLMAVDLEALSAVMVACALTSLHRLNFSSYTRSRP